MKIRIFLLIVCVGAIHALTSESNAQDLSRTQGIVDQALQLADAARANSQALGGQAPVRQGWSNPFSTTPPGTTVTSTQPGTGVAVTGSNIRVNAGGLQLDIPRVAGDYGSGGVSYPTTGVPVANPLGANPLGANPLGAGSLGAGSLGTNALQKVQYWKNFADAVNSFHSGNYGQAASLMTQVSPSPETVPAFNHFHALCSFANGNYDRSAEFAYAGLAQSQPVYSWDQLRGYYDDPAVYTRQYQALQSKAAAADATVSTQFLLGYHHLMLGHRKHASQVFERVLTRMPNDPVVKHTLTITQQQPPQPRQ
ncbi:hypothetical protein [Mariniblastus fucicola]|uniref:Tetratricopeptide repeat protein n=1 Tax=Mariniblastus fucicola TaxID=980251 RepID=A0A5B9PEH6_9BACT|nr:hypothetical protein [Mariniblastus fucicola]QEG21441.1 hypothetical protein MFFC18_12970 [Mariniblastus fucicola]